ncbi:prostaglandin D2 receptor isoform X2 [Aricia agestis]|nr:prostaglandin D2 receptor isoform X2 [Aricia agestis]
MLGAMVVSVAAPQLAGARGMCVGRVVLRVFGIGSVCIAVTMALERYLALTRPFLYQKQVTYFLIRLALLVSWSWAAALTCAPVLGVGLYYDAAHRRCVRYRNAATPLDVGYAIFYVAFGTLLCIILVYCNLAVMRALYAITSPRAGAVVRRVSRRTCARDHDATTTPHNAATAEEVAFSRLMATLSVLFMLCWLPQMVTSALYLALGPAYWNRLATLGEASDVLMLLNYVLNPVLYVLMRQRRLTLAAAARCAVVCFKRKHKSSRESGSCCLREETTVVVSDSGSELRPLAHVPTARLLHTD